MVVANQGVSNLMEDGVANLLVGVQLYKVNAQLDSAGSILAGMKAHSDSSKILVELE